MGGVCSQPKGEEPKKKNENCLGRYSEKGRHRPSLVSSLCDLFNYVSVRYTNRGNTLKEVWLSGLGPILSISALFTTNIFASLYRRLLQTVHIILWQFLFKTITKKKKKRKGTFTSWWVIRSRNNSGQALTLPSCVTPLSSFLHLWNGANNSPSVLALLWECQKMLCFLIAKDPAPQKIQWLFNAYRLGSDH